MGSGVQDIPLRRIPTQWDPKWFSEFVRDVLQYADARNMRVTGEMQITGQSDDYATLSVSENGIELDRITEQPALSVIGNPTSGTGTLQPITAGTDAHALRRSAGALSFGQISGGGIADDAITDAKLRDSVGLSVIGRSANSTGNPADIAAANDAEVLRRSGATIGFGTIATAGIADDAVTNAKLANMAQDTIKGRTSGGGTGDPVDLTAAQVATIVSAAIASALNVTSGTWTPTLTNVANVDASTAYLNFYVRIGAIVICCGKIDVDATAAGATTRVGITLPIASNLGVQQDCCGTASGIAVASLSAGIVADTVNDRAQLEYIAVDAVARGLFFVFGYRII